jgi:hypothetical protein
MNFQRLYAFQLQVARSVFSLSAYPLRVTNTDREEADVEKKQCTIYYQTAAVTPFTILLTAAAAISISMKGFRVDRIDVL